LVADTTLGIACFFTAMTVAEGGGRRAVYQKLRDMYVPTLKANFMVWPAVQIINFRLMPVQFQLVRPYLSCCLETYSANFGTQPFVSSVGIAWTAYLSLTNAAEDVEQSRGTVDDRTQLS
jgi:protein Mpv17